MQIKMIDNRLDSFLVGSKLGDGSFIKRTENHNTYIVFKHAVDQYEYLNWKYNLLKNYNVVNKDIKKRNWTKGKKPTWQDQYYFATKSEEYFNQYKDISITELINKLDELALSVWILDDGNFDKNICKIACGRFSEEEKQFCLNILKDRFNIDAYSYNHPTKERKGYIRIPAREYKKIENIILKNIPNSLDVIKSKLGIYKEKLEIKIKYLNEDIIPLCFIENKSDWIDLRAAETVSLKKGEYRLIPLGVAIQLPEGYEAYIVPRSSTYKNFKVIQTNHHAVIDESYCGDNDEWKYPVYALEDTNIELNDRICQFRIQKKMPEVEFIEVDFLGNKDRGGIGGTGIK